MLKRVILGFVIGVPMFMSSACAILIAASGKGDIKRSMENRDRLMIEMGPGERSAHVAEKTAGTMSWGRDLFVSSELGRNGQACDACHPGGGTTGGEAHLGDVTMPIPTLLGAAAAYPRFSPASDQVVSLSQMINNCLELFMDGRPLELDSGEMVAITMYVASLSNGQDMKNSQ